MAGRRRRKRRREAGAAGRRREGPALPQRPPTNEELSGLEGAQLMPALGGSIGLPLGCLAGFYVAGAAPNPLVAVGGFVLATVGGAFGGLMAGSWCKDLMCNSINKRMRRP